MKKRSGVTNASILAVSALIAFAFLTTLTTPAAAQRASKIVAVDDSDRITLPHTTHPLARPGLDLGQVEPGLRMERMLLVLGPGDEVQPQLRAFVDSLHDKKSANFHKWITPEAFGERFGPSQQDVAQITGWLQQKGFDNIKAARGRTTIEFSGSAQLVQQAFGTQMHYYQLGSEKHLANSADISIPRALSGIVRGVTLENFSFSKPSLRGLSSVTRDNTGKFVRSDPNATDGGGNHFLAPGDYARIYDLNPLYNRHIDGTGASIAVVARSNISLADVETFRQAFHLPANDPIVTLNGQDPGQNFFSADFIEASLDAEWTGAIAPNANVNMVVSQSTATADGAFLSEAFIVDNNLADIMSVSFNECEPALGSAGNAFFNALYQQAAAEGISVLVGSGDAGAADCEFNGFNGGPATTGLAVNGLGSTPFNTAVGGTEFNENGNATFWGSSNNPDFSSVVGYIPEVVWNESCDPTVNPNCFANLFAFDATGGGVSSVYSKPSWQSTGITGVPNDNQRDLPDVSLTAASHDGYLFCVAVFFPCVTNNGSLSQAGIIAGTSASVQAFAGIMALVDQQQQARQGLANYVLYKLAANEDFANCNSSNRTDPTQPTPAGCIFNDTTEGNNGVPGNDTLGQNAPPGDTPGQVGYNATAGFDSATGLGSVDATNLVNAWNSVAFLGSTTTLTESGNATVQHGQPLTFNVNVAALSGSGTPTGEFVMIARNAPAAFNNTSVAAGTLSGGMFSGTFNTLPGGQYQVAAHYGGDGTFGGSESGAVNVTVTPENSSVAITGNDQNGLGFTAPASITVSYGVPQRFFVTVTSASGAGTPTGTVVLLDGGTPVAQAPLDNNGQAQFSSCDLKPSTLCLAPGPHTLTINYSGDNSVNPSTSAALRFNVVRGPAAFSTFIACCFSPVTIQVAFEFTVGLATSSAAPTGTIHVSDNFNGKVTTLGNISIATEGLLFFNFYDISGAGNHSITVTYLGDNNYLPTSTTAVVTAPDPGNLLPTQTTAKLIGGPVAEGQIATFQVNVTSNASTAFPTGVVQIEVGGHFIGFGAALNNGTAIVQGVMPNGATVVQATYPGDSTFLPSVSAVLPVSTKEVTPGINLSASAQTVQAGAQVSLIARMSSPLSFPPSGTVQFFDSVNGAASVPLGLPQVLLPGSGSGLVTTSASLPAVLSAGLHTITVSYSGDPDYNPVAASLANSVTITVNPGPQPVFGFGTPSGGNQATIKSGQTAQFNVFLNSNGFVGPVALSCSGAPAGMSCAANPTSVMLSATATSVPFVVTVGPTQSASANFRGTPFAFTILFGMVGMVPLGFRRKKRAGNALFLLGILLLITIMGACGSPSMQTTQHNPQGPPQPNAQTFTLVLTGTNGSVSTSIPLTLTVNP
ncbi:MAG TPA: Ig-like domain repeat protein [Candidatus Sulfotelmatobacter sp.]|nr:Ig-like domain repeat protein [Candidatus Sulfotelmatobacter sp.]